MVDNSIAAELFQQINLTKLRPTLNYLSASDALTVEEFVQTNYGCEYSLDVSNITWGSASNDGHVFDIFCEFRVHRDSTKTRLDMLYFVAVKSQCYKWDCHVFFKMAYWGTKADKLAIYVLSDMLKVHSFIITKNCPWTTIDASVKGTVLEILNMCPVKLVNLGHKRFGRLWPKLVPSRNVSTLQTSSQPVFPDAQLLVTLPAPPTLAELKTAQTFVTMQENQWNLPHQLNITPSASILELQEPSVLTLDQPIKLVIENPPVTTEDQFDNKFVDAMDKIVNHIDVSYTEPWCWLKFRDCMDLITGRMSELVETVTLSSLAMFNQIKTKPCTVDLVQIKYTPTLKLPTLQTEHGLFIFRTILHKIKTKAKEKQTRSTTKKCKDWHPLQ